MRKVITYGTFDLFHEGHRRILERAKALGDHLIVGVSTDQYHILHGKMNVVDSLMQRIDNVRRSGFADEIIVSDYDEQKIEDIQKYNVDVFVKGSDSRGKFDHLKEFCEVVYLERTKDISSTEIRSKRNGVVQLGIVGTGGIAERTMQELQHVGGVAAMAVYNPRLSGAVDFAKRFEIDIATDDFERFLAGVDAVYVASPHGTHYEYSRRALTAGKHVLCEKPMTLRESENRELFELSRKSGTVLMEAIKTAYAPGFQNLLAIAKGGRIGVIRDVEVSFTKLVPPAPDARAYDPVVGGSFTELASYSLLPIMKLLGTGYMEVRFEFFSGQNDVDIYTKAYFRYPRAVATAKTGIGVKSEGQLLVSGTKGYILAKSPWWQAKGFEVCYENPENNESYTSPFFGYGMRMEIADFVRNIREPSMRNYKLSREDSIATANVIERFLKERDSSRPRTP